MTYIIISKSNFGQILLVPIIIKLHTLSKTLIKSMWKASGSLSIAKDNSKKFPLSSSRITKSKSSLVIDLNDCFSWLLWLWLQLQSMSIMVSSSVQVSKSKKYILKSSPQTSLTFVSKSRHWISFKNNLLLPKKLFLWWLGLSYLVQ